MLFQKHSESESKAMINLTQRDKLILHILTDDYVVSVPDLNEKLEASN